MDKLLLTPTEAADVLGIGRSKVYELMRSGTLRSVRIDSCRRIPVEDLNALVARLRTTGTHAGATDIRPEAASA
jgi:excisionase family DNA binding protein